LNEPFDELAKALAQGVSRREALRRVASGVVGTLLAGWGGRKAWAQAPESGCESYCRGLVDPRQSQGAFGACVSSCEACVHQSGALCGLAAGGGVTCCTGGTPFCGGGVCLSCCDSCDYQFQQAQAACDAPFDVCVQENCSGYYPGSIEYMGCQGRCDVQTKFFACVNAADTVHRNCLTTCSC
jgi:hypothetical protein